MLTQNIETIVDMLEREPIVEIDPEKEREVKKKVASTVQLFWYDTNDLKQNIEDLFEEKPGLKMYYGGDYVNEIIQDVKESYLEQFRNIVKFVMEKRNVIKGFEVPELEHDYEAIKRGIMKITEHEEKTSMKKVEEKVTQNMGKADVIVYGIFYDRALEHVRELMSQGNEKKAQLEMVSNWFTGYLDSRKSNLVGYGTIVGMNERELAKLDPEFESYHKKTNAIRSNERVCSRIKKSNQALYNAIETMVDVITTYTQPRRFQRYYGRMQELIQEYKIHCSKYSAILEKSEIEIERECKEFRKQITDNPSTNFLHWHYKNYQVQTARAV